MLSIHPASFRLLIVGAVWFFATPTHAATITTATFTVFAIDGGGFVNDQDPWPLGDPERYFRFGVFDAATSTILDACAAGCIDDGDPSTSDGRTFDQASWSTGSGFWDFPDRTITKVLSGSGAYFYFGLWDKDNDADDSLGDNWFFASAPISGFVYNNNQSPYYADNPISYVAGRDVEGTGDANNFRLQFSVTFDSVTVPEPSSSLLLSASFAGLLVMSRKCTRRWS